MKALMVYGGWDGHEPKQTTDIFEQVLKDEGFEVRVEDSMDVYTDQDYLHSVDLVVPTWTMGEISKEQSQALCQAVFEGHIALGGWHGGMCDAFRSNIEYQLMTGGQFLNHPGGIIDYEVNIIDSEDPITRGLSDFAMKSEQYNMLVHPSNQVLATTTFSGEHGNSEYLAGMIMPVVWKKQYGKGRVFYSALGHVATDFDVPECKEIQRRGLLWAAGCLEDAPV
ncbi:MAG: ThuA domain-containing protein [Planctomycetota bacterium]|jgi:type 1 glutamine amidotransferase|nr:ThuA domain-containing protein [Planctomycetota bacterium]